MRSTARQIFLHALAESSVEKAFARHLGYEGGALRVGDDLYSLGSYSRVLVVSIGKAGHCMAEVLSRMIGTTVQGIIADPNPPPFQIPGYRYFAGGHPQPNAESWHAAESILKSLGGLNSDSLALFMVSGGGSATVEKPADAEVSLDDLIATYRTLVHSGAPITQINAVRKHLSAVKGGRMAQAADGAQQVSILASDVPEHALDSLASGPTMPDSSTVEDCFRIAAEHRMLADFPHSVRQLFESRLLEETPKADDSAFVRSRWWKILSAETAEKAAADAAVRHGFRVEIDNACDDWDYAKAADYLLDRLRRARQKTPNACIVCGGEVTVKVGANPGAGGRNQQFALYCAEKITDENIVVLSAGTDGIDGNTPAAGAVTDGTTMQRARTEGVVVSESLRGFNAFPLLEKLGDTIHTGPTGTNVRDLRILLAY
jgi:hydroxypyruvate reductase